MTTLLNMRRAAALAVAMVLTVSVVATVRAQAPDANAEAAERRAILESDRFRQLRRNVNNWLTEQRIYSPQETASIRARFDQATSTMSANQLKDFMDNAEEKLDVLNSPDALEARQWVEQFRATARNADQQLQAKRPDIIRMTPNQIRAELDRFHRQRGSRQQSQAAVEFGRSQQVQSARNAQTASQQAQQQMQRSRSQSAANMQAQRQQPASFSDKPGFTDPNLVRQRGIAPVYTISPWGTPVHFNPLSNSGW